ncbi:hypothetical protein DKX38_014498 [Salix brachista]|uniref:Uncharacterized protein n=1 Tax=Salix brachista TaxID=2182728 RepID=A0A5N5LFG8_9ROSI|nr:hypothetical protein DKX38_014498 [Salix brachista]
MHPAASVLEKNGSPLFKKPIHTDSNPAFQLHKTFTTSTKKNLSNHLISRSSLKSNMGIRLQSMINSAKHVIKGKSLHGRDQLDVPKGHVAVYVGEMQKKRFVVPISYLSHPSFRVLLNRAEEEFGFNPPMGGLTIPCREDAFIKLASRLQAGSC